TLVVIPVSLIAHDMTRQSPAKSAATDHALRTFIASPFLVGPTCGPGQRRYPSDSVRPMGFFPTEPHGGSTPHRGAALACAPSRCRPRGNEMTMNPVRNRLV